MKKKVYILFVVAGSVLLSANVNIDLLVQLPAGFPELPQPKENELTSLRVELGRKLFFDPILSSDSSISCGSCHRPSKAFADNVPISPGVEGRFADRNAPSLANIAYHPYVMKDGGVPTIEQQVLVPLQEHTELDLDILEAARRIERHPQYSKMAKEAYPDNEYYYALTHSIACFERTLISGNAPFDQWFYQGNKKAMTKEQKKGFKLFKDSGCIDCHSGFNFTNYNFENNGLYKNYADSGRARITRNKEDRALFKVASLRNVAVTYPYMHDGSIKTLEEVIEHYNLGGKAHFNKNELIRPLGLKEKEKRQLLAFLNSLTDSTFLNWHADDVDYE